MGQLFKETPKQKEIVLIPVSYSNLEQHKVRPTIIVSNNKYNQKSEDMLVVPLTTNIKNMHYTIQINRDDLEKGELDYQSEIRTDKISSIKQDLIQIKIGIIKNEIRSN
jgi:mRNA interferase MazF